MDLIECSETSAIRSQTLENYPKEIYYYTTRRKLRFKKSAPLLGRNYKTHSSIRENAHQVNQTCYIRHLSTSLPWSQHYTAYPTIPSSHPFPGCQLNLSTHQFWTYYEKGTPKQTRIRHHIPRDAEYTPKHCQSNFRIGLVSDKSHACGREQQGQTTQEIRTVPNKTNIWPLRP